MSDTSSPTSPASTPPSSLPSPEQQGDLKLPDPNKTSASDAEKAAAAEVKKQANAAYASACFP